MIIVIVNMITITMIGWNVYFCERPRALCVVGEVWGRMGADSKVQEGVAGAALQTSEFPHTFHTDSPSYYYDHFKSSSLFLGFRKIGTQKFFEYTNNDNSLNTYYYI